MLENAPVSVGQKALVMLSGDHRFSRAGGAILFFDTRGALKEFQFSGDDFFATGDVCSIALEVPDSALGLGRLDFGTGRRTKWMANGSRRTEGRCPRNRWTPSRLYGCLPISGAPLKAWAAALAAPQMTNVEEHFGDTSPLRGRQLPLDGPVNVEVVSMCGAIW